MRLGAYSGGGVCSPALTGVAARGEKTNGSTSQSAALLHPCINTFVHLSGSPTAVAYVLSSPLQSAPSLLYYFREWDKGARAGCGRRESVKAKNRRDAWSNAAAPCSSEILSGYPCRGGTRWCSKREQGTGQQVPLSVGTYVSWQPCKALLVTL